MSKKGDLWVISCYYNPCRYASKRANFERFVAGLNAVAAPFHVVECAFGSDLFDLPPSAHTTHIRGPNVLWQKERLLNIAMTRLPSSCSKIAWVDCDLIFEDADWLARTSCALDVKQIVQPFSTVVRLPPGVYSAGHVGEKTYQSFASVFSESPQALLYGDFKRHGHTGFAWAGHRDVVARHGLYDVCLAGSGDHLMAHAFCGDWSSSCITDMVGSHGPYRAHFERWAVAIHEEVDGSIGSVHGRILHLWHGAHADRQYARRNQELQSLQFDPHVDLALGDAGLWTWASSKHALHDWSATYFCDRREDPTALNTLNDDSLAPRRIANA